MKKQHLDSNAKRDFSMLAEKHKKWIREWLRFPRKTSTCPLERLIDCCRCRFAFPETQKQCGCPCHILYVKDVVKIARAAVR